MEKTCDIRLIFVFLQAVGQDRHSSPPKLRVLCSLAPRVLGPFMLSSYRLPGPLLAKERSRATAAPETVREVSSGPSRADQAAVACTVQKKVACTVQKKGRQRRGGVAPATAARSFEEHP